MNDFDAARSLLVRQAFWLEWLTIGWMIIEAVVATASGIVAGSISLVAFGIDSFIELASAGVLVWRLSFELKRGRAFSEKAERIASIIAGGLLLALIANVVVAAAWERGLFVAGFGGDRACDSGCWQSVSLRLAGRIGGRCVRMPWSQSAGGSPSSP